MNFAKYFNTKFGSAATPSDKERQ